MSEAKRIDKMTADDYYSLPEGTNAQLINGIIYDMSPAPARIHQRLITKILTRTENFISSNKGGCEVYTSPFDVQLNEDTVVQPDISVICDKNKLTEKGCNGAPDWIVEIVSGNASDDYYRKLMLYRESGVREYWIVDPKLQNVVVYVFEGEVEVKTYKFDETVPVHIYGGRLTVNVSDLIN